MNTLAIVNVCCIAVVGLINLLPMVGILSADRLAGAYGISVDSPELELLLRHRALLFGLIGGFVLASLAMPQYRSAALILAGISMAGFLVLGALVGDYGDELRRVARIDMAGLTFLVIALITHAIKPAV